MKKTARARENPALQRGLEGSVDGQSKVLCRSDHRDWGTISERQRSGRRLADGKVTAPASLSGRSNVTDQSHAGRRLCFVLLYWERGKIILTSSAKSRTLPCSRSDRSLTNSRNRRGQMTDTWGAPLLALKEREKTSCTRTPKERCVRKKWTH